MSDSNQHNLHRNAIIVSHEGLSIKFLTDKTTKENDPITDLFVGQLFHGVQRKSCQTMTEVVQQVHTIFSAEKMAWSWIAMQY